MNLLLTATTAIATTVLSLFDGMSCGQIALNKAGVKYDTYYAAEVDKHCINIAHKNYPNTVHLGDVTKINSGELFTTGKPVDLLIGGSPCQGFSFAGKQLNFEDPRSKLFFEFVRILKELREINPDVKFLLENVRMKKEYQDIISDHLGVQPIEINSNLLSAQNRKRLFWTNIEGIEQPTDKGIILSNILETEVDDKYYHSQAAINYMNRTINDGRNHYDFAHHCDTNKDKSVCITANFKKGVPYNVLIKRNSIEQMNPFNFSEKMKSPSLSKRIYNSSGKSPALTSTFVDRSIYPDKNDLIRRLTPIECERLQTVPDNYTQGVSDSQRYKMLGNGWTVDVIAHIFSYLK